MSPPEPTFIISKDERTRGGALSVGDLNRVARTLLSGGFALLPSDTAYSVAGIAVSGTTRTTINTLLRRGDMPMSVAFPSLLAVRRWIEPNPTAEKLLARYCPGPITVVCPGSLAEPSFFFSDAVRGPNRTIGVRIPDSIVERDVAATTGYPITTVAVRDLGSDQALTSFEAAIEVVESGMELIGGAQWCAIEGASFYKAHSTVVQVSDDGAVTENRSGDIPFAEVLATVQAG